MMSSVIAEEFRTVAAALAAGAVITLVYDLFRIFRRAIPHGNFWIGAEDLIFWIWASLWIFSVLYRENDGNVRMYTILAMALGMILYHKSVSDLFVSFFGRMLKIPITFFGKKLKKLFGGIIIKIIGGMSHDKDET